MPYLESRKNRAGKLLEGSRLALFFLDFARAFGLSKSEVRPKVGAVYKKDAGSERTSAVFVWSGQWESNPPPQLGRLIY